MAPGYVHVEVETAQSAKQTDGPCGDVAACDRSLLATTIVCADGVGSGIRARIAAEMCASRLLESLRIGFSLRRAFEGVVYTMEQFRDPSRPFAAFTVARVRPDGAATVLAYEAPEAILVSRRHAAAVVSRPLQLQGAMAQEANCVLEPGDSLIITSDGITQAGLGQGLAEGWRTEGVVRFVNDCLADGLTPKDIPHHIHHQARRLWKTAGDDCTAILAHCRRGQILNILTGPPANAADDARVVRRFLQSEGIKVVCGGSTAALVARQLGERLEVEQDSISLVAPPRYEIPGIDLVTEGAVTLNQVYNLLDEDIRNLKEDSGVTELCALLQVADRVNVVMGRAKNKAAGDVSFRQRGILTRNRIVPLVAEKLRAAGKLVVVDEV